MLLVFRRNRRVRLFWRHDPVWFLHARIELVFIVRWKWIHRRVLSRLTSGCSRRPANVTLAARHPGRHWRPRLNRNPVRHMIRSLCVAALLGLSSSADSAVLTAEGAASLLSLEHPAAMHVVDNCPDGGSYGMVLAGAGGRSVYLRVAGGSAVRSGREVSGAIYMTVSWNEEKTEIPLGSQIPAAAAFLARQTVAAWKAEGPDEKALLDEHEVAVRMAARAWADLTIKTFETYSGKVPN